MFSHFYDIALVTVKLGILAFYYRVFIVPLFRKVVIATAAFVIAWGIGITVTLGLVCRPIQAFWDSNVKGDCLHLVEFTYFTNISNLITDIWIFLMPVPVIWHLQLQTKKKLLLCFIFSIGLAYVLSPFLIFALYISSLVLITFMNTEPALCPPFASLLCSVTETLTLHGPTFPSAHTQPSNRSAVFSAPIYLLYGTCGENDGPSCQVLRPSNPILPRPQHPAPANLEEVASRDRSDSAHTNKRVQIARRAQYWATRRMEGTGGCLVHPIRVHGNIIVEQLRSHAQRNTGIKWKESIRILKRCQKQAAQVRPECERIPKPAQERAHSHLKGRVGEKAWEDLRVHRA